MRIPLGLHKGDNDSGGGLSEDVGVDSQLPHQVQERACARFAGRSKYGSVGRLAGVRARNAAWRTLRVPGLGASLFGRASRVQVGHPSRVGGGDSAREDVVRCFAGGCQCWSCTPERRDVSVDVHLARGSELRRGLQAPWRGGICLSGTEGKWSSARVLKWAQLPGTTSTYLPSGLAIEFPGHALSAVEGLKLLYLAGELKEAGSTRTNTQSARREGWWWLEVKRRRVVGQGFASLIFSSQIRGFSGFEETRCSQLANICVPFNYLSIEKLRRIARAQLYIKYSI